MGRNNQKVDLRNWEDYDCEDQLYSNLKKKGKHRRAKTNSKATRFLRRS